LTDFRGWNLPKHFNFALKHGNIKFIDDFLT